MTLTDPCFEVLRALALEAHRESSTRLDTIMHHAQGITWAQAETALTDLQLLGHVRSLTRGYWFITREGLASLRRQTFPTAREPRHG